MLYNKCQLHYIYTNMLATCWHHVRVVEFGSKMLGPLILRSGPPIWCSEVNAIFTESVALLNNNVNSVL